MKQLQVLGATKVDKALPIVQKHFPKITYEDLDFIWSWTAAWNGKFSGDVGKRWLAIARKLGPEFAQVPAKYYRGIKLTVGATDTLLGKAKIKLSPKTVLSWTSDVLHAARYAKTTTGYGMVLRSNASVVPLVYLKYGLLKILSGGGIKSLLPQNEIITKGQQTVQLVDVLYIKCWHTKVPHLAEITGIKFTKTVKPGWYALAFRAGKPYKWI